MSPVAKRRGGGHTGRAVSVAILGVAIALGTAFGVATLASQGDVEVRLGDDRFDAGRTENLAEIIAEDGQPILFPDPANFSRAIYVDHVGDDPDAGWLALSAEGDAISLFGLPVPPLVAPDEALAERVEELHELGGTIGYFLIGMHAIAALAHHYLVRDNTLLRMLPGRGEGTPAPLP